MTAPKRRTLTGLVVIAALAVPAAAGAQASRQNASLRFTTQAPGASTGLSLSIDYFDPARPGGKPYSVQTVIEELAAGATIDTSVPAACTASDAQLMAEGPSACSSASVVGSGSIDLDTGNPLMRDIPNKVTFLNAPGQQIFLTETTNQPGGVRTVTRAKVSGRTLRSDVPPIPGAPPPDNFAAVERVRAEFKAIRRGGRNYITTPPTCPGSRRWQNRIRFTYRDGVTQPVTSSSPCSSSGPRLALRLTGRRSRRARARSCFRGRVRGTVIGAGPRPGDSARFSGGRLDTRRPLSRIVDARRHRGRSHLHRARARVRLTDGRVVRLSRRYRVCGGLLRPAPTASR